MYRDERRLLALAVSVGVVFLVAAPGAVTSAASTREWYDALAKPSWTPPGWLFGPVWTALYLAMAVAAWQVWRVRGWQDGRGALGLYGAQLLLNGAWSPVFFGLERPGWALAVILLLLAALAATVVAFWRASRVAGLLLAPYLAWVAFATALNFAIWRLNA